MNELVSGAGYFNFFPGCKLPLHTTPPQICSFGNCGKKACEDTCAWERVRACVTRAARAVCICAAEPPPRAPLHLLRLGGAPGYLCVAEPPAGGQAGRRWGCAERRSSASCPSPGLTHAGRCRQWPGFRRARVCACVTLLLHQLPRNRRISHKLHQHPPTPVLRCGELCVLGVIDLEFLSPLYFFAD